MVADLAPVAADALAVEVLRVEAAGFLTEAVGAAPVTLVIDDVEHLAEIMGGLPEPQRWFLEATSLLHGVTAPVRRHR